MQSGKKLITLAGMLRYDEDALICDLADTYGVHDYRSLPCRTVAAFSVGLRDDSRIKMKIAGMKQPMDIMLLAAIADRLSILAWQKTEDGMKGRKAPKSILEELTKETETKETVALTIEEFEARRKAILGGAR